LLLWGLTMIHYHGLPITPETTCVAAVSAGHAFISWAHPAQFGTVLSVAQSFALDNGAFSAWKAGDPIRDWSPYYAWVYEACRFPSFDFAIIPDVIDGTEAENDVLLDAWPLKHWQGVPVWHLHESLKRLERLTKEWPRVALGSSGEFAKLKTPKWWTRMGEAVGTACNLDGMPRAKLHGLRMLDPQVFRAFPFSSADSTNIARNVNLDVRWSGSYAPATKEARARVLRERIELCPAAIRWEGLPLVLPPDQAVLAWDA
jgi:hypothetical protein